MRVQPWEGAVVEAPFLWQNDGTFYLFYSANSYANGAQRLHMNSVVTASQSVVHIISEVTTIPLSRGNRPCSNLHRSWSAQVIDLQHALSTVRYAALLSHAFSHHQTPSPNTSTAHAQASTRSATRWRLRWRVRTRSRWPGRGWTAATALTAWYGPLSCCRACDVRRPAQQHVLARIGD